MTIRSAPHPAGTATEKFEKKEVNHIFSDEKSALIKLSSNLQIFFDKKKNGYLHFLKSYGKLNGRNIRDSYPIPIINEWIYFLGEENVLKTVYENFGYF